MAKTGERDISSLSPFELKDLFIHAAKKSASENDAVMLNAGRGNPNWIATESREAFFLLGKWGLEEARRSRNETKVGMAGMPQMAGSGKRLTAFLSKNKKQPGATLLKNTFNYGVKKLKFKPDAFAHELSDAIIGDQYTSVPDRMLVHTEKIVHEFIVKEMCDGHRPKGGKFDIFSVEGGTAAMCYIFKSLMANRILKKGDTIALGTPIFTPYIEFPHIEEFGLHAVNITSEKSRAIRPASTTGSTPRRNCASSRIPRSRRSSSSIRATRPRMPSARRRSIRS